MTSEIYLSLGSNTGNRHALIGRAVAALSEAAKPYDGIVRVAEPVTSLPMGFDSENPFVNVGVLLSFEKANPWTPEELERLLDMVQNIERSISTMPHRNPDGSYRDREIDMDIISVDELTYSSPRLTIPHPMMAKRAFVLGPMAQLLPGWHHPQLHMNPEELLAKL